LDFGKIAQEIHNEFPQLIIDLRKDYPHVEIIPLDVYEFTNETVIQTCSETFTQTPCTELFWDNYHFSSKMHEKLAEYAFSVLENEDGKE